MSDKYYEMPEQQDGMTVELAGVAKPIASKQLWCELTADEMQEAAADLANAVREHQEVEADKKAAAADFKGRLEALAADIGRLAARVGNRRELRPVECDEVPTTRASLSRRSAKTRARKSADGRCETMSANCHCSFPTMRAPTPCRTRRPKTVTSEPKRRRSRSGL